jgi:hypothetical protein
MATMEEALVPLYLHHRYQAEAVAKVVGGLYYTYAMRGDGQEPLRLVPGEEQWGAVQALLATLDPAELTIPRGILDQLPPRPFRYGPHQELFSRNTGLVFDAVAPSAAAADMTLAFLLHPERAARLVQQSALDPRLPGLGAVLDTLIAGIFSPAYDDPYQAEVNRAVERVIVDRIMALAGRAPMSQVRALATQALQRIRQRAAQGPRSEEARDGTGPAWAHFQLLDQDIQRFLDRPQEPLASPTAPAAPPGSPIGDLGMDWLDWDWWWTTPGSSQPMVPWWN